MLHYDGTFHSMAIRFNKRRYVTFWVVMDNNHEMGSLEKYAFNQTTYLSRPFACD